MRNKRSSDQGDSGSQCSTLIRGCDGHDGQPGVNGDPGPQGPQGPAGVKGDKGDAGSSGATYVRWGRTVCPPGAERIYTGLASSTGNNVDGGTDESLCLPNDPEYLSHDVSNFAMGTLYHIEYAIHGDSSFPLANLHRENTPCAVCYVNKSTILTIPAKYTCPTGWTREYYGYLTTEHTVSRRRRKDTICVDVNAVSGGGKGYTPSACACFMDVKCNNKGHACPPYAERKPLTCAVCSK